MRKNRLFTLVVIFVLLAVVLPIFTACDSTPSEITISDTEFVCLDESTVKLTVTIKNTSSNSILVSYKAAIYKILEKSREVIDTLQSSAVTLASGESGVVYCYLREYVGKFDNKRKFEDCYDYKIKKWTIKTV